MRMGGDVLLVGYLLRRRENIGRHMVDLVGVVYGATVSRRWVGSPFEAFYILLFMFFSYTLLFGDKERMSVEKEKTVAVKGMIDRESCCDKRRIWEQSKRK